MSRLIRSAAEARFCADVDKYRRLQGAEFRLEDGELNPQLEDFEAPAANIDPHYFWMDLWAARKIYKRRPDRHVDVGSRLDGFVSHLLTFTEVEVVDIRPPPVQVDGLTFVQEDATLLSRFLDDSVESLSSLHAVEHFGLGRYGDPIDPEAWRKAMRSMVRVLAPEGRLYFAVPIGRERVAFNAHRVFDPITVLDTMRPLELIDFARVNDCGEFLDHACPDGCRGYVYGCGMFEFGKA